MALGLTIPKGEDELKGMGRIITRGGRRMASEVSLKTIKMLEEGALFPFHLKEYCPVVK